MLAASAAESVLTNHRGKLITYGLMQNQTDVSLICLTPKNLVDTFFIEA
jgi:hypothetical protein